ncbi:Hsp20/alpha crystallin family protein [Paenibacillus sp. P26]|nr:Hsp20/alpha crystallin family protein [Paenibacillus sp. P26]
MENYVKDVMKQALPSVDLDNLKHHFHTEVFDTHNNVIVKVHIPDRAEAQKVRVKLSSNQVRLDGSPNKAIQTIKLNSLVYPDSCKAVYKNGIMQLHMRKQSTDQAYHPVDIRFL